MKILIRADGSALKGAGHVMRCLALAQGWQRAGGDVLFVQAEGTPSIEQRLLSEGMQVQRIDVAPGSVEDAALTLRQAQASDVSWIVADGYAFDGAWQKQIKDAGFKLLQVDDNRHAEHYYADLVLNQNLYATEKLYPSREQYTRLLLGTRYVQLRREFIDWRNWKREMVRAARKVLVTLGGGDPENVTGKVVSAVHGLNNVEVVFVVGGSNPHLGALRTSTAALSGAIRLVVDAANLPELMAWADLAIAGAGTTSWELAFMGVPSIVMILAENQRSNASVLDREGISINFGDHQNVSEARLAESLVALLGDKSKRAAMSRRGRNAVDGLGTQRVVDLIGEVAHAGVPG